MSFIISRLSVDF